ncbi:hypothetical protein [Variovorax paradoxus]|uniref:hypothetical protein n=1 Tax=Variovorax paradoxus TaxID=34073 RepID=UPI003D6602F4
MEVSSKTQGEESSPPQALGTRREGMLERLKSPTPRWRRSVLVSIVSPFLGASLVPTVSAGKAARSAERMTLWEAINALAAQAPFSKPGVEGVLSLPLRPVEQPANPLFDFFDGAGLELQGGLIVSRVDLRIKKEDRGVGLLVLNLDGACIGLDDVRARHESLAITGLPRGGSAEEAMTFTSSQAWGKISFGFKERRPKCLAYVVLDTVPFPASNPR